MTGEKGVDGAADTATSRRNFFRLLAGSPLLALLYPALPPDWRRSVSDEFRRHTTAGPHPSGMPCPDCGQEMVYMTPFRSHDAATQSAGADPPDINRYLQGQLGGNVIESPDQAVNVWDMEQTLHASNLPEHWAYLHMGVDDFETRRVNREGYMRLAIRPRRLGQDATKLDTSVQIFGRRWETPLFLCPVAALEAYHTQGESGAARAARAKGILQIQSNASSQSYETISAARGEPHWFQIYTVPDWDVNKRVIDRVARAGCPALVWTVDLLGGSNRELSRRSLGTEEFNRPLCQNCHNHKPGYQRPMNAGVSGPAGPRPPYTWDYVKRLKDTTSMKVLLKGIVTREDAEQAIEQGVDGIVVSNHGGRAESSGRATIEALPEIVAGVRGRVPVLIDSGVRRGADIFKALALGATAVGIGRPYVWGLGSFGEQGVEKVISLLLDEFTMVMRQTRTTAIDQIKPGFVMEQHAPALMRNNALGFGL
jgi:4-hydroxymandelate oxidase